MPSYDPNQRHRATRRSGRGRAIGLLILAVLLVVGGLLYLGNRHDEQTSTARSAAATQSGPVPANAPAPGPTSTAPVPNR